jgi:hypothetical protein
VPTIDDVTTAEWKNIARKCERVLAGDKISVNVMGGWVTKPAPWDGYVFKSGDTQIYVPDTVIKRRRK